MDGDWVTDYRDSESIDEVQECLADQGSRWFFYPITVVIRDHGSVTTPTQRIVDAPEEYAFAKGRTLRQFGYFLDTHPEFVAQLFGE